MKVTVTTPTESGVLFTLDVSEDLVLADFKVLCEAESAIPLENILLIFNGRPLVQNTKSLKDLKIVDGDVVMIHYDAPPSSKLPSRKSSKRVAKKDKSVSVDEPYNPGSGSPASAVEPPVQCTPEDVPVSGGTNSQDCVPCTSNEALRDEEELKKKSSAKKKTASAKKVDSSAMLPEAGGVYNELSYKDEMAYLQYYKENGFDNEELSVLKKLNPGLAETVINAQKDKTSEHEDLALAIQLSIGMIDGAAGGGGWDMAERVPEFEVGQPMRPFVAFKINGCEVKAFISTRCRLSILDANSARKCQIMHLLQQPDSGRPYIQGTGNLKYYGFVDVDVEMQGELMRSVFHVFELGETEAIIGLDWLNQWECELSFVHNSLHIRANGTRVRLIEEPLAEKEQKKQGNVEESGEPEGDASGKPPSVGKGRGRGRRRVD